MVRDFGFIVIPKNYTFPSFQPCLYFDPQLYYTSDRCGIYIVRIVKTLLPISIRVHTSQKRIILNAIFYSLFERCIGTLRKNHYLRAL